MPITNLLAMALGLILAAIGVLGIAYPSVLFEFGRSMRSAGAVYFVAALRVAFGIVLIWAAPDARTPRTLRVIGVLIIIAGLVTPFLGVERWSTQGSFLARSWPALAVIFGLFIAYVAMPKSSGA